jgi:hypothetical protein
MPLVTYTTADAAVKYTFRIPTAMPTSVGGHWSCRCHFFEPVEPTAFDDLRRRAVDGLTGRNMVLTSSKTSARTRFLKCRLVVELIARVHLTASVIRVEYRRKPYVSFAVAANPPSFARTFRPETLLRHLKSSACAACDHRHLSVQFRSAKSCMYTRTWPRQRWKKLACVTEDLHNSTDRYIRLTPVLDLRWSTDNLSKLNHRRRCL